MPSPPSPAVLNARYVAIRTAEARGLTDRLLQAARDRTPGVRRLAVPMLYRFWYRERDRGWDMLARIGADMIRFPGIPDGFATETFAEVSLAVLNRCRDDPKELQKLAALWRGQIERLFGSPIAKVMGRSVVLKLLAKPVSDVLRRQPAYQPLNFKELGVTFSRPDDFREAWREALACLDRPEQGLGPIAAILARPDLPFDLYLMLLCERTLIYHGAAIDPDGTIALIARIFADGCAWFRQSAIYVLFHILGNLPAVEESWLDRYAAMAKAFFTAGDCQMTTSVASYDFSGHLGWPEIVFDRHRPGSPSRIVVPLMQLAVHDRNDAQIEGLFKAIDTTAFAYGRAPLALRLLERSVEIGGAAVEDRALKTLATVRLQDQPLVDAFLQEHPNLSRLQPRVAGIEPTIREEDMPSLLDGLTVHLILTSDYFRARMCEAFHRAAEARSAPQLLVQILEWLRDEFSQMPKQGG